MGLVKLFCQVFCHFLLATSIKPFFSLNEEILRQKLLSCIKELSNSLFMLFLSLFTTFFFILSRLIQGMHRTPNTCSTRQRILLRCRLLSCCSALSGLFLTASFMILFSTSLPTPPIHSDVPGCL